MYFDNELNALVGFFKWEIDLFASKMISMIEIITA